MFVPSMATGMAAEQLARVFGTEEDPVNCAFYFKVGVCRNGDKCTRKHNRPTSSQTLLLLHMYTNPPEALLIANDEPWDEPMYDKAQQHLELFYHEVFLELANYGEIEDVVVVDNVADHQIGNVYVKYYYEEDAERALKGLLGRWYGGKLIQAEYTTVTDFREARCRAFHETRCNRQGQCKFLHIKHVPKAIKRRVCREMYDEHPEYAGKLKKVKKADKSPPRAGGDLPYDPLEMPSDRGHGGKMYPPPREDRGGREDAPRSMAIADISRDDRAYDAGHSGRDRDRDRDRDRRRDRDRDRRKDDYDPLDAPEVEPRRDRGRGDSRDRDRKRNRDPEDDGAGDRDRRRDRDRDRDRDGGAAAERTEIAVEGERYTDPVTGEEFIRQRKRRTHQKTKAFEELVKKGHGKESEAGGESKRSFRESADGDDNGRRDKGEYRPKADQLA